MFEEEISTTDVPPEDDSADHAPEQASNTMDDSNPPQRRKKNQKWDGCQNGSARNTTLLRLGVSPTRLIRIFAKYLS